MVISLDLYLVLGCEVMLLGYMCYYVMVMLDFIVCYFVGGIIVKMLVVLVVIFNYKDVV